MEIILYILGFLILFTFAWGAVSAAPWLPTKKKQRQELTEIIPLEKGMTVYDLGCGDGSVLFDLARKNPEIKAVGLEISLLPYFIARLRKLLHPKVYQNVQIKFRNFFREDLSRADVVFVFLLNKCYNRLVAKFYKELRDEALVVVEAWSFPEFEVENKFKEKNLLPVYFYRGRQFRD